MAAKIKHLAITLDGIKNWAADNSTSIEKAYAKAFDILKDIMALQVEKNIPIITLYLLSEEQKSKEQFQPAVDTMILFLDALKNDAFIHNNKIKISSLGKWYDLPGRLVDSIKSALEATKDYDCFFLNLCINYDGQEEIVDACRLIARKIKAEKLDINSITKQEIKDNIYTSYFMPPDAIIKNGKRRYTSGLLLWDSARAEMIFTGKNFPDTSKQDYESLLSLFPS